MDRGWSCWADSDRTASTLVRTRHVSLGLIYVIAIGTAAVASETEAITEKIELLSDKGLDTLELGMAEVSRELDFKTVKSCLKANNISLSGHAPYSINLGHSSAQRRERSKEKLVDTALTLDSLSGDILTLHPAYYAESEGKTFSRVKEGLEQALNTIKAEAIDTKIGVEITGRKKQFGRLYEVRRLCDALNYEVSPVIDFGHIFAREEERLKTAADFKQILDTFKRSKNFLHVHVACVEADKGEEVKHLPLSAEKPDFKPLANALTDYERNVRVILETPEPVEDAITFKNWVTNGG